MYHSRLTFSLAMAALAAILSPSTLSARMSFQRGHGGARGDVYAVKGDAGDDMTWARTYGDSWDDEGYSVQQTSDGGYVVAGSTESFRTRSRDVYVIKTDAYGDTVWTRTYGGTEEDEGRSVKQTSDGGYAIAGSTKSFGAGDWDVYLIKTDASGDTLWTRTFGGPAREFGNSVRQTTDNCYIIAGSTESFGAGEWDVYLIKTDAHGDTLWTRTYGEDGMEEGFSVQETRGGGYIISGYTAPPGGGDYIGYLIKTNASGDTLWTRTFLGTGWAWGWEIQQTTDGGYVVIGSVGGGACLVKTDGNGATLWTRNYYGTGGRSVQQTTDGGYVIVGSTEFFGEGWENVYLIKTDAEGDTLWTRTFTEDTVNEGNSVRQTADGGYIIAGFSGFFGATGDDVYLIKTDSLGNVAVAEQKTLDARRIMLDARPNPSRGRTTIRLSPFTARHSPLALRIYDAQGRRVRTFTVNREPYTVWDGTDELGQPLPSGTYFLLLNADGQHATARLVLQR